MADLKLDMTELAAVKGQIQTVFDILDNSALFKDDTANAVGHSGLAAKVREFSDNWNDRREDVVERLTYVKDTIDKIESQFTDVDGQLYTSLTAPPAPTTPVSTTPNTNGPTIV
ncbi:hypothetical protein BH09ACT5_BH09ACT5_16310 [soil metagenome]